jgi:hypothetical protein
LQDEQGLVQTRRWLSDKKKMRWQVIFDNYGDPDQFRIEQYYPNVSHGTLIQRPDLVPGSKIRMQPLESLDESVEIFENSIFAIEYQIG